MLHGIRREPRDLAASIQLMHSKTVAPFVATLGAGKAIFEIDHSVIFTETRD
jgi:hypothetical protein